MTRRSSNDAAESGDVTDIQEVSRTTRKDEDRERFSDRQKSVRRWEQAPWAGWTSSDRQFLAGCLVAASFLMSWRAWNDWERTRRPVIVSASSSQGLSSSRERPRPAVIQPTAPGRPGNSQLSSGFLSGQDLDAHSSDFVSGVGAAVPSYQIDINQADWVAWAQLDRIGETLARRIVSDRLENGPFKSIDDVQRVRGIGVKTLERIRPHLTLKSEMTKDD